MPWLQGLDELRRPDRESLLEPAVAWVLYRVEEQPGDHLQHEQGDDQARRMAIDELEDEAHVYEVEGVGRAAHHLKRPAFKHPADPRALAHQSCEENRDAQRKANAQEHNANGISVVRAEGC